MKDIIDRWSNGWRPYLLITSGVCSAMGYARYLALTRPVAAVATATNEIVKGLPVATEAVKPIATAILAKATPIANVIAPKIVEHISRFDRLEALGQVRSGSEYDLYIIAGVLGLAALATVYLFGHAFLKNIFGGSATKRFVEIKRDTPLGSMSEIIEGPNNLVTALINAGGKEKVSAEVAEGVFIDVKAVASIQAAQEVLADHPELLQQMNNEAAKIEKQLVRKARIFG